VATSRRVIPRSIIRTSPTDHRVATAPRRRALDPGRCGGPDGARELGPPGAPIGLDRGVDHPPDPDALGAAGTKGTIVEDRVDAGAIAHGLLAEGVERVATIRVAPGVVRNRQLDEGGGPGRGAAENDAAGGMGAFEGPPLAVQDQPLLDPPPRDL